MSTLTIIKLYFYIHFRLKRLIFLEFFLYLTKMSDRSLVDLLISEILEMKAKFPRIHLGECSDPKILDNYNNNKRILASELNFD